MYPGWLNKLWSSKFLEIWCIQHLKCLSFLKQNLTIPYSNIKSLWKDDGALQWQIYLDSNNVTKLTNTTRRSVSGCKLFRTTSKWLAEMIQSYRLLWECPLTVCHLIYFPLQFPRNRTEKQVKKLHSQRIRRLYMIYSLPEYYITDAIMTTQELQLSKWDLHKRIRYGTKRGTRWKGEGVLQKLKGPREGNELWIIFQYSVHTWNCKNLI